MPEEPLPRMRAHLIDGQVLLQDILTDAKEQIQKVLGKLAKDPKLLSRRQRNAYYKKLREIYGKDLVGEIEDYAQELALAVAEDSAQATLAAKGIKASKQFNVSKQWINDVYTKTFGSDMKSLVALHTDKMAGRDIQALETVVRDGLRRSAIEGTSARDLTKELIAGIGEYAQDPTTWQFIDAGGKKWDTGNYFAMLNRTITARFTDEAVQEQAIQSKFDDEIDVLYVIETAGTPCPICESFSGVIVSEAGIDPRFQVTVADAKAAGWRHPNCVCSISVVNQTLAKEEIDKQGPIKKPPPNPTKEDWREYRNNVLGKVPEETKFRGHSPALDNPTRRQKKALEKEALEKRK